MDGVLQQQPKTARARSAKDLPSILVGISAVTKRDNESGELSIVILFTLTILSLHLRLLVDPSIS